MSLIAPEAYPNPLELPPWRVLIVRSQHEARVAELLESKADECYPPTYQSVRRWHDRRVTLDLALFPSYLFARFDWDERDLVLASYGVQRILSYANVPAIVTEAEIAIIAQMVASGRQMQPVKLQLGQKVRITSGVLSGIEGVIRKFRGKEHLIVTPFAGMNGAIRIMTVERDRVEVLKQ